MIGIIRSTCVVLTAVALVGAVAPQSEAAIGCGTVVSNLHPCIPYVTNKGPLRINCCSGIKTLNAAAKTKQDRQSVCNCLKSVASSNKVDLGRAAALPSRCGVKLRYKISPSTDCSKVR